MHSASNAATNWPQGVNGAKSESFRVAQVKAMQVYADSSGLTVTELLAYPPYETSTAGTPRNLSCHE